MAEKDGMSRRGFGKWVVAAAGGTAAGIGGVQVIGRLGPKPESAWHALTETEARALEAVAEQMIPTDRDPGAKEARVVVYIDRQLAKDAPYQDQLPRYQAWLAALDALCRKRSNKAFAELPWPDQTHVLQELEAGRVPKADWQGDAPQDFFRTVLIHVKQGFYGSPVHGGNFNYVSYRMLGVVAPSCVGRNRVS